MLYVVFLDMMICVYDFHDFYKHECFILASNTVNGVHRNILQRKLMKTLDFANAHGQDIDYHKHKAAKGI